MTHSTTALELRGLTKSYRRGREEISVLRGIDLVLGTGSFTAVMGPSGSGKSTLLHCASGLDHPTAGAVTVHGRSLSDMREDALARFRREHLGFVFQHLNLLPYLSAQENVELSLRLAGRRVERAAVLELLAAVGLDGLAHRMPAELSGGQQQRVAIARATIASPAVLFADEPTGALDSRAARDVLALLRQATDLRGQTTVMVTHDPVAAANADEVIFFADGRVIARMTRPTAAAVAGQLARLDELAAVTR